MKTINEMNADAIARGAQVASAFGGNVRNMDAGDPWKEGDTFTIPKNYQVLSEPIKGSLDENTGKERVVTFINVEVANGNEKRIARFFPNQLAKIAFPVVDGVITGKVKTTGSATAEYSKYSLVDEAMQALAGKTIKIVKDTVYTVFKFNDRPNTQQTHIYQYDLV